VTARPSPDRATLGRSAEQAACNLLVAKGLAVVDRNYRALRGELDIICRDGDAWVFVEVKAGRAGSIYGPERPVLAVGPQKQRRIRRLATAWMSERRGLPRYEQIRFDAIGVTYDRDGRIADYEHIRDAF